MGRTIALSFQTGCVVVAEHLAAISRASVCSRFGSLFPAVSDYGEEVSQDTGVELEVGFVVSGANQGRVVLPGYGVSVEGYMVVKVLCKKVLQGSSSRATCQRLEASATQEESHHSSNPVFPVSQRNQQHGRPPHHPPVPLPRPPRRHDPRARNRKQHHHHLCICRKPPPFSQAPHLHLRD